MRRRNNVVKRMLEADNEHGQWRTEKKEMQLSSGSEHIPEGTADSSNDGMVLAQHCMFGLQDSHSRS